MDYRFIEDKQRKECCGCEACSYICPKHIVKMREDKEGFVYPVITNSNECLNCGLCAKVCPISSPVKAEDSIQKFCSGYLKSDEDIQISASGGLATAISRCFIEQLNGVVYGVAYSSDYKSIRFEKATRVEELEKFRGSKYAQARKSDEIESYNLAYNGGRIFKSVISDLQNKLSVLFIGLPCEVAALVRITKHKYDNLFTMELVCHGPTSQRVHRDYINSIEETKKTELTSFSVRYKHTGWKPYYIKCRFAEASPKNHLEIFHQSTYGVAFRYLKRPSCSKCIFKLGNEKSGLHADITLGDFHYAGPSHVAWNKWGSSVGYIHNPKGEYLIDITKESFHFVKTNSIHAMKSSFALEHSVSSRINRKSFSNTFVNKSLNAACSLYSVSIIDAVDRYKKNVLSLLVSIRNSILKK